MKYIKLFENVKIPELKTYLVWHFPSISSETFEVFKNLKSLNKNGDLEITHLYNYKHGELEKITSKSGTLSTAIVIDDLFFSKYIHSIIYQSDKLKDCLDFLEALEIANKYNI